tara:strand:+ start:86 stop:610 length:525 start_codon:yes stop_codon:yes gene_type:complete
MTRNIKIIDNCIPIKQQDLIINELLKTKLFPWFYCDDITYQSNKSSQHRPGLSHYFFRNKKQNSDYSKLAYSIIAPFTNKPIIQSRAFLQFPLNLKLIGLKVDALHIDLADPHMVYLYYVIDADGDTLLFEKSEIIKRVSPKKGRLLIFNGKIWHTAQQPQKGIRCIINSDVVK